MQDVVPPHHDRSIRNIPVAKRRHELQDEPSDMDNDLPPPRQPRRNRRGGGGWGGFLLWAIAVVIACVLLGMLIATLFSGASVKVYPRRASVQTPATVAAALDAPVGTLPYKLVTVTGNSSRTVAATGSKTVNTPAQGTITISNLYAQTPQKLVTNTRFQGTNGKIYRIHQAVTIPGATKNVDGTLKAGTVTATVYADQPGPDYNSGSMNFTIPGFKGSPQYSKITATTDQISGGASGNQPAVSDNDLSKAQSDMKQEIAGKLPAAVAGQVPDGYIAIPGTLAISYGNPLSTDAGNNQATVTENATATEAMVRSADLASAIATAQVQGYKGEAVDFGDPSAVQLSVSPDTPYSATGTSFSVAVNGQQLSLVWQYDPNAIEQALAGKNRSQFDDIIKGFAPAVAKATASLRPFWETSFPAKPEDIKISTEN